MSIYLDLGWKATCIGSNSTNGSSMLKSDYKEDMTLKEAKSLAIKVLTKTMDGTTLSSEKCIVWTIYVNHLVEFAVISMINGKVLFEPYSDEAVDSLLKEEAVSGTSTV